jgi:N-acetylglucosaminyldiphosphoundecaprenol N-acetyl-beta-D-mannosaminyltransferase
MQSENILGYPVTTVSLDACVDMIMTRIDAAGDGTATKPFWLACFNPHSYAMTLQDETFARALKATNLLIPDGAGVVMASRIIGGAIHDRVTGSDVFARLHKRMNAAGGMTVFFLGATDETLSIIRQRMATDYPNVKVGGIYSPPFKPEFSSIDNRKMIAAINAAAPDVLWVGMSAPKQEKFIFENRALLNVKFAAAVGAVFDFYSGRVKRSHPIFQRLGLEWLPRLLQQPRRLWRRTFISALVFIWHVLMQRFGLRFS